MLSWDEHEQYVHGKEGPLLHQRSERARCFICNELWDDLISANKHLRKAHKYDRILGRLFEVKPGDCLKCDHCPEMFTITNKRALHRHIIDLHFPSFNCFKCEICGKVLKNDVCLKRHIKVIHSATYDCKFCEKSFIRQSALQEHIKGIHGKKFTCEKCQRSFHTNAGLSLHLEKYCYIKVIEKPKLKNVAKLQNLLKLMKSSKKIPFSEKFEFKGMLSARLKKLKLNIKLISFP